MPLNMEQVMDALGKIWNKQLKDNMEKEDQEIEDKLFSGTKEAGPTQKVSWDIETSTNPYWKKQHGPTLWTDAEYWYVPTAKDLLSIPSTDKDFHTQPAPLKSLTPDNDMEIIWGGPIETEDNKIWKAEITQTLVTSLKEYLAFSSMRDLLELIVREKL